MKVLVTGGAGFIGSHIADLLVEQQFEVVVLDDLSSGCREHVPAQARFIQLDVCSDAIAELFAQEKFDAVIHQAAQTMVTRSITDPALDSRINIQGSVNLLEACRATGVKKFIFASTAAVYGDTDVLPVIEETPLNPKSFYGLSKFTAENYIRMYHAYGELQYTILRYANVFGERQGDGGEGGVVSIFSRAIQQGQELCVHGTGEQTRDFIYVKDVAAANLAALRAPETCGTFNVSTQQETSVNRLTSLLGKAVGITPCVSHGPVRDGDIFRSALSNQRLREKLAWQPRYSVADGLRAMHRNLGTTD